MGDSDNTRLCPSVTRRMLLTSTMAATAMWPLHNGKAVAAAPTGSPAFDPALSLWHEWKAVYIRTAALCRKQQALETLLVNTVGFPQAKVRLPGEDVPIPVSGQGDIEELFGDEPTYAEVRAQAEADLAAHQIRWDVEDKRIGYSAARRAERAAANHEQEVAEMLMMTPATTLAGVGGKLDAILREGESWEDCTDFPWPQIRSVLCDLVCIGQAMQPGIVIPGSDHKGPYPCTRREGCCFRVEKHAYGAVV